MNGNRRGAIVSGALGAISHLRVLAGLVLAMGLGVASYENWSHYRHHETLLADAADQADQRARLLAETKAGEVEAVLRGIDMALRHFRDLYAAGGDPSAVERAARNTLRSFPPGTVNHFSAIDAHGYLEFSTLGQVERVFVGDRDYFLHHQKAAADEVFINKPIRGRHAPGWIVLVTRPILKEGRFAGVAIVALTPDSLAVNLARLRVKPLDSAALFYTDGAYLARNRMHQDVMGKTLPKDRPFLASDAARSGVFRTAANTDGRIRRFAWQRLDTFPLVLTVGIDEQSLREPIEDQIAADRLAGSVTAALFLLLCCGLAGLLLRIERQRLRLARNEALLRATLDSTDEGVLVVDASDRILAVNDRFLRLWDIPAQLNDLGHADELRVRMDEQLATPGNADFRGSIPADGGGPRLETLELRNGKTYERHVRSFPLNGERVRICSFHDVTERKRIENDLLNLAATDPLTELPNRRHFIDRLQDEMARVERLQDHRAALLMIDLDHFKEINDTHGHSAGDAVLRSFAQTLREHLRKIDTAARLGGEEFGVILPGADIESAEAFAERLRSVVESILVHWHTEEISVTASFGVTLLRANERAPDSALQRADAALYRAKRAGRNRIERELAVAD